MGLKRRIAARATAAPHLEGLRQHFTSAVRGNLQQLTPWFDAELTALKQQTYPPEVVWLLFEYNSPEFGDEFAVCVWKMTALGEAWGERVNFLAKQALVVPPALYRDEKYEAIDHWHTASKLLEEWLFDRWSAAAANRGCPPAFVGHHDSHFKRSLATGARTDWDKLRAGAEQVPRVAKVRGGANG